MIDGSPLLYEEKRGADRRSGSARSYAVGVSAEGELGTIGQTGTPVEGGAHSDLR